MATFFLVRHGATDVMGHTLTGRSPGVHLNPLGRSQVGKLAAKLAKQPIKHVLSSPLERTRETAEPIAKALGLTVEIAEPLFEVDFGEWTGRTIAQLEKVDRWKQWNQFRSEVRIPGGETMLEIVHRMLNQVQSLETSFPGDSIVLVSHGDPIRGLLTYFLGMPLDLLHRLEIGPASVSIVSVSPWGPLVRALNLPPGTELPAL